MTRPPAADGWARLAAWLAEAQVAEVRVISPHLDDAVFSLAGFLARDGLPPRRVLTVFTRPGPATDPAHARAMGFADVEEEFAARRREDEAAMARLGTAFEHLDLESGRLDDAAAGELVRSLKPRPDGGRTLVLLPLGAGAELSQVMRLVRRILRQPPGCGAHGDHLWVRDRLGGWLAQAGVVAGYYAEIPYQWANAPRDLSRRARGLIAGHVHEFALAPDVDAKIAAASDYASQIAAEFGTRPSFRRRTAAIAERLFLPAPTGRPPQGS
ncbi:MAG: PIG-L family deacetylase [Rhodobacteraceae bacterium]|nr:PIG-L family deacetylase [Paracoccaceae bacterium]